MKIVVACDKFKGSLTADAAGRIVGNALRQPGMSLAAALAKASTLLANTARQLALTVRTQIS